MPKGFRPLLEPPSHRRGDLARRPCLCVAVTFGISLFVLTVFGLTGWNVWHNRFDLNGYKFHRGDEVSLTEVSKDLSSTFCKSYQVTLQWTPGKVWLLPHRAQVNTTIVDSSPVFLHQAPYRELNLRAAYLLQGSIIDVTACRENGSMPGPARVIVIRGPDNLRAWRRNNRCESCTVKEISVPSNAFCGTDNTDDNTGRKKKTGRLIHRVKRNANFFIFIAYDELPRRIGREYKLPGISLNGTLERTRFNVRDAERKCLITDDNIDPPVCVLDLPWNSDKDIVVKLDVSGRGYFEDKILTKCMERVVFWVLVFGVVPILCIIPIAALLACVLCRRTRRNFESTMRYGTAASRRRVNKRRDSEKQTIKKAAERQDEGVMTIQDE